MGYNPSDLHGITSGLIHSKNWGYNPLTKWVVRHQVGLPSEMQRGPFLRGKAGKATDHIRRFPEMGVPPNHLPSGKCLHKTMENHHF